MYSANNGVLPSSLFDQSFAYEGLVTNIYAGGNIKIKNVAPFSWHSNLAGGQGVFPVQGNSCFMVFITASLGATIFYSVAGKDAISCPVSELSGKMIIFDSIAVLDSGSQPLSFQVWGWKIDLDGSTTTVPSGGGVIPISGAVITIRLKSLALWAFNSLTNTGVGMSWYVTGVSDFVLDGSSNAYEFTVEVIKLGGATGNDDYSVAGFGTPVILNVDDLGNKWRLKIGSTAVVPVAGGLISISPTPNAFPPGGQRNVWVLSMVNDTNLDSYDGAVLIGSIGLGLGEATNMLCANSGTVVNMNLVDSFIASFLKPDLGSDVDEVPNPDPMPSADVHNLNASIGNLGYIITQ